MTWKRTDGTLLGWELQEQVGDVERYFAQHGILAVLEFHPLADQILALRFLVDEEERVATLVGEDVVPGIELEELVADIADRFDVDVMVGDFSIGNVADDEEPAHEPGEPERAPEGDADHAEPEEHDHGGVRAITVLRWEPERAQALARATGHALRVGEARGRLVVLTDETEEAPPEVLTWPENRLPAVQVIADGDLRTVVATRDADSTTVLTWGASRSAVPGAAGAAELLAELSSDGPDAAVIAALDPEVDPAAISSALAGDPVSGPARLLAAFGLGADYAQFLAGTRQAADVPHTEVVEHVPPTRVVREKLSDVVEKPGELRAVEIADTFERDRPVLARGLSAAMAATGVGVLIGASRERGVARRAGITVGVLLILNAVADLAIYRWLRGRRGED